MKLFDKTNNKQTVTEIVESTFDVSDDGSVTFRASMGKGSGRPVSIPGEEFDNFVDFINRASVKRREVLSQKADVDVSVSDI